MGARCDNIDSNKPDALSQYLTQPEQGKKGPLHKCYARLAVDSVHAPGSPPPRRVRESALIPSHRRV